MYDILPTAVTWLSDDHPIYIATVTQTWGSSPRRAGAKMLFRADLSMVGSVSGGCIENAVIEEGLALAPDSTGKHLYYGVSDDTAWSVGLSCGGNVQVFVERLNRAWWTTLATHHQKTATIYAVTVLAGALIGEKAIFDDQFHTIFATDGLTADHLDMLVNQAKDLGASGHIIVDDATLFVDIIQPQPHLIIIGGNHIAIPLSAMAKILGYRVSLIDPRSAFANPERFPQLDDILNSYPDKALHQLGLSQHTYVTVLTHDPKIDDPALITALQSDVPYIGVLSSRKTHEKRKLRLAKAGISEQQLARIQTPIGLNIGSQTPEEIAVSIIAEIIATRRNSL